MAKEYLDVDVEGLYLLMELYELFWTAPSTALANEILKHRQCFGLTPIDRRRLQWEIKRVEAEKPKLPAARTESMDDPRRGLSVV